ncbi:hypothetical protein NXC14_CH01155 [Rhizobium sp. NXC14]|nr:hypothetical protein NXC14_CH01155 [Rhizobium sp. NXC14]
MRSGHRPTISRTRPRVNAPGRTSGHHRSRYPAAARLLPPRQTSVWCTAFKDMNLVVIDDGPWNPPCGRRYGSSTADRCPLGHPCDL